MIVVIMHQCRHTITQVSSNIFLSFIHWFPHTICILHVQAAWYNHLLWSVRFLNIHTGTAVTLMIHGQRDINRRWVGRETLSMITISLSIIDSSHNKRSHMLWSLSHMHYVKIWCSSVVCPLPPLMNCNAMNIDFKLKIIKYYNSQCFS